MLALGVDPGLRCTGVATYNGQWFVHSVRPKTHTLSDRIREIVGQVVVTGTYDVVVVELPQVYPGRAQKGDPNDLISLATLVGAIVACVDSPLILLPKPRQWKGQVPKKIHHARIRACAPDLGRQSLDALDAVGLCLYGLEVFNGGL